MYIKYRLDTGTMVKVFAPGWMPGVIDTEVQAQALSDYNRLRGDINEAYNKGTPHEGYHVTMIEEKF